MRAFSAFSWSTWVCLSLSWDESNNCWYPGLLSVLPVQKGGAISWDCDSCRLICLTDGDFSVGRDAKCAEISVFVAKMLMQGEGGLYAPVFPATSTEGWVFFMCPCLEKSIRNIQKTPGGLLYGQRWSNMWSGLKTPEFRALLCMLPVTYPL